jgi:hypothetical protein
MPHEEIMKYIGNVFLLRMNVNHVGSILDAPVSDARLKPQLWTDSCCAGNILGSFDTDVLVAC